MSQGTAVFVRCWWRAISTIRLSTFNMHVFYVLCHTHVLCMHAPKPDLGWCHVQLLRGWRTVSAPQHGALWSACQADWQVNDTNENQRSLPPGVRHWVTASKQPEKASLNLKVISLTRSFFLFFFSMLSCTFPSASTSFASFLASSNRLTLFSSPSFSFPLCGYFFLSCFHWRPLSYLTVSHPPPSFSLSFCPSSLWAAFDHRVTNSQGKALTYASPSKMRWKVV